MSKIIQTRSEHKGILEIKFPYRFNSFGFSYHVKTFWDNAIPLETYIKNLKNLVKRGTVQVGMVMIWLTDNYDCRSQPSICFI